MEQLCIDVFLTVLFCLPLAMMIRFFGLALTPHGRAFIAFLVTAPKSAGSPVPPVVDTRPWDFRKCGGMWNATRVDGLSVWSDDGGTWYREDGRMFISGPLSEEFLARSKREQIAKAKLAS